MNLSNTCVSSVRFGPALLASAFVCACSAKGTAGPGPALDAAMGEVDAAGDMGTSETPGDAGPSDGGGEAEPAYVPVATQLLDDVLSRGTDGPGTAGIWYTYSDRTLPWAEPGILLPDAAGVLVPGDVVPVLPTSDGGPTYLGSTWPYRRFSGGGEAIWGVGLEMTLFSPPPDGGPVPMNGCGAGVTFDVDAAGMDSFVESAVDASGWTGIQFWAKSLLGYPRTVNVFVNDDRTDPWGGRVDAGGCDVCANYAGTMGFCGDGPRASVVFTPGWTHLQLPFTSMHPVGIYSGEPTTWTPDTSALFSINFQLEGVPIPPFDLAVAYIELYK
jgi:hypothetical protein